jgi:hypothetical protein
MERDVNEALGQQHVSEHVETLQEKGSDVVKSQDELTIDGQSSARRPPGEMVRGESYDVVLPCSPTPAWVAEADQSHDEIMAAVDDEEEVEQGRPAHTRKPPAGMTPAEMNYAYPVPPGMPFMCCRKEGGSPTSPSK